MRNRDFRILRLLAKSAIALNPPLDNHQRATEGNSLWRIVSRRLAVKTDCSNVVCRRVIDVIAIQS